MMQSHSLSRVKHPPPREDNAKDQGSGKKMILLGSIKQNVKHSQYWQT